MRREVTFLIASATGLALVAVASAYAFGGSGVATRATVAFALCVPLGAICLELSLWSLTRSVTWQLGMILGGSLVRVGFALALGMILYLSVPVCRSWDFWLWLAAAYLATLAIDVGLVFHAVRASVAGTKGATASAGSSVPNTAAGI